MKGKGDPTIRKTVMALILDCKKLVVKGKRDVFKVYWIHFGFLKSKIENGQKE